MEPENDGSQKESPFPGVDFQVPCLNFRGVNKKRLNIQNLYLVNSLGGSTMQNFMNP